MDPRKRSGENAIHENTLKLGIWEMISQTLANAPAPLK